MSDRKCAMLLQDFINMLIRECNHEMDKFPTIIGNMSELQQRKDLKQQLDQHRQGNCYLMKRTYIWCPKIGHTY